MWMTRTAGCEQPHDIDKCASKFLKDFHFTVRDFGLQRRAEHASNTDEAKLSHVWSILISLIS